MTARGLTFNQRARMIDDQARLHYPLPCHQYNAATVINPHLAMSILEAYVLLTRHIVPGPRDVSYFIPMILLPISLLIPRTILSRWQNIAIFMPAITLCSVRAWKAMDAIDVISMNTLLWATFLTALQDPWQDYRLVRPVTTTINTEKNSRSTGLPEVNSNGSLTELRTASSCFSARQDSTNNASTEEPYPSPSAERLLWVGQLLPAIKLDNWKISRPSHDRLQPLAPAFESREAFLKSSFYSLIRAALILESTRAYIKYDVYFTNTDVSISSPLPFDVLRCIPPQLLRSMITGAQAYAMIGELFYLPAAIPVILNGLGLLPDRLSPHTWPAYFGSPIAIFDHGVRGFWGSFWHQTMRWTTSGPGYAMADALRLPGGSFLRYALITLSAFGFSGLVHIGLVPPEPLHMRRNANEVRLSIAGFFWLQPIAILLEVLVAKLFNSADWKQGGRRKIKMTVNGVWTMLWFTLSLPLLMDAARQLGYWSMFPLPLSFWMRLWTWVNGQGPTPWSQYKLV